MSAGQVRVVAITDDTGTLITQQRYLPFGAERIDVGTIAQTDFGFTSQRDLDEGMGGLMDYRARFYSPYLNRFLQPDSLIPDANNPQAWNRYSYVFNRPVNLNDPTGHCPWCVLAIQLIGLTIAMGQIPSDVRQENPNNWGDPDVMVTGIFIYLGAPEIVGAAGEGLMGVGQLIKSPRIFSAGYSMYSTATQNTFAVQTSSQNNNDSMYKIRSPKELVNEYKIDLKTNPATEPYVRPSYSVTASQRASVQNKPCVYCGRIADVQIADHKTPSLLNIIKRAQLILKA